MKKEKIYSIYTYKKLKDTFSLSKGKSIDFALKKKINKNYNYSLNIVGEVDFDYTRRFERILPIYYRKLDDSIVIENNTRFLVLDENNKCKERSCYTMIKDNFEIGKDYILSLESQISNAQNKIVFSCEIYYGERNTRYYYEQADRKLVVNLDNSSGVVKNSISFNVEKKIDFVLLKIEAIDFDGIAKFSNPSLVLAGSNNNLCHDFDYCPDDLDNFYWIGEGFSTVQRPYYKIYANNSLFFEGRITDRLQRFSGFDVDIPENLLNNKNNVFTIEYSDSNIKSYNIKEVRLIVKPKEYEILGYKPIVKEKSEFGVFAYIPKGIPEIKSSEYVDFVDCDRIDDYYCILKFFAKKQGDNVIIETSCNGINREIKIDSITCKDEFLITGTGDFIYVNQNMNEFSRYLSWFLTNNIGDLLTFRNVYHWGGADELNVDFWKKAVKILCGLKIYYSLMLDGRELNGINANPSDESLKSDFYLGSQLHERDGAYIYWDQNIKRVDELYYHILSRKIHRYGMYGKHSPQYDKNGNAQMYFAPDGAKDIKSAYELFSDNIKRNCVDGSLRHTGVTTMFRTFLENGFKWIGYESMYGPHELMFGALRGAVKTYNLKSYGSHLALQWSTVPTNEPKHYLRYKISLYLSYMHGVTEINTEEGLWHIENPFADFDNFSKACVEHTKVQNKFNRFIQTHTRRGIQKVRCAMIVSKYDGMEGFSSQKVFGQDSLPYSSIEKSWEAVKVFYPESDINAIYYYIKKGGNKNVPKKDRELMEVRKNLYRDIVDYKQVGFYTNTPYGVIDIIPEYSDNFSSYDMLFFTGFNYASDELLEKLCKYVENGGKLLISKVHLFRSYDRNDILGGKCKLENNKWIDKLLQFSKEGKIVFFDKDNYPFDYIDEYKKSLENLAEQYSTPFIKNTKHLSFTEYSCEDGMTVFYLLNINWWNNKPATYTLNIAGKNFDEQIKGNDVRVLAIKDDTAVYSSNIDADITKIENGMVYLSKNVKTTLYVFDKNGKRKISINGVNKVKL